VDGALLAGATPVAGAAWADPVSGWGGGSGAERPGASARWFLLAFGVATVVRLLLLRIPTLWYDEATTGLLGLAVLRGELPVYFFGQAFMGALDGYLAAPVYWTLGVSARTLELVTVLLALAGVGLTVRLAYDGFGSRPALFTALLLAVPPNFLLYWSHEARGHYPLGTLLGTLALLLALRAPAARSGRATLLFALLGGTLGLAFWTNFLSLVYYPAVAVLLLRRGFRPLVPRLLAALPAFALGSLPQWLYGVPHGTALPPPGPWVGIQTVLTHLGFFGATAWPIVSGVPQTLRGSAGGAGLALVLGALYVAAVVSALRAVRRAPAPAGATSLALVVLACTNVGIAVVTQYGRGLNDHDPHYLLPLYTALPPLLGRFLAGLLDLRRALALTVAVLLFHALGALEGSFRNLHPALAAAERAWLAEHYATIEILQRDGIDRLYAPDVASRVLTFLSAERLIFSNHYDEVRPSYARAVDGARRVAWLMPKQAPILEENFAALGLRFTYRPVSALGGVYGGFELSAPAVRELAPTTLQVTASDRTYATFRMTDRVAETVWNTVRRQRGGEWIRVDLGEVVPLALIRWLPGMYEEVPRGLRVEVSSDEAAWRTLVDLPEYVGPLYWSAGRPMARVRSGRVELRVAPTPARYLRITQTGQAHLSKWAIRELYVYAATGDEATTPVDVDGAWLAQAVAAAGVRHLYADHGWASRVALADPRIRVPPANLELDDYGFKDSVATLLPFHWEPGTGVLLESIDAEGFAAAAHAGGLAFARRSLNGLTLFVHAPAGRPLTIGPQAVSASRQGDRAGLAVDGHLRTRWATAAPRAAGDSFRVDLTAPRAVRGLRLAATNPADLPAELAVEGSSDGVRWQPLGANVRLERRHGWSGFGLVPGRATAVVIDFPPATVKALRIVLRTGDPSFDWSISELTVYGDE
jgi:hypothetical protein